MFQLSGVHFKGIDPNSRFEASSLEMHVEELGCGASGYVGAVVTARKLCVHIQVRVSRTRKNTAKSYTDSNSLEHNTGERLWW